MVTCLCVCESFTCTVHVFQCAFLLSMQVISGEDDPAGKQLCASEHFWLSFYQKYCNMFDKIHDASA